MRFNDVLSLLKENKEQIFNLIQLGSLRDIEHGDVFDEFVLQGDIYNLPWAKLISGRFKQRVFVNELNINQGLGFENCIFEESVHLNNVITNGYSELFSFYPANISFLGCTFKKEIHITGGATDIELSVLFEECIFDDVVDFNDIKIQQGLNFKKCIFKGFLDILNCIINQKFNIENCTSEEKIRIEGGQMQSIVFNQATIHKKLFIWSPSVKMVIFSDGEYHDDISLKTISNNSELSIKGSYFKKTFTVEYADKSSQVVQGFNKIYLDSCAFDNGLNIEGIKGNSRDLITVEKVDIKASAKLQGDITFSNLNIETVNLTGINFKANFTFNYIYVNLFAITYFYNYSKLVFLGIRPLLSNFNIDKKIIQSSTPEKLVHETKTREGILFFHSNLGAAHFFDFDFESFNSIYIYNTILSEIIVSNVKWFHPEKLKLEDEIKLLLEYKTKKVKITEDDILAIDYNSLRELFRQLKYACETQGDRIKALDFQKWEMIYHKKYLKLMKDRNLGDRIILWISQTNDFGQNWIKATWIALLFTFIFYIPLAILGSPRIDTGTINFSVNGARTFLGELFYYQIPAYFQLLNPTHSLNKDLLKLDNFSGLIYFFDFLHRLVTSFFIFQIIFSFRKYIRR
jgi:hypothetical protein